MQDRYRIVVPLSKEEFTALSQAAKRELRPIRDHARYLLRGVLADAPDPPRMNEGHAVVVETTAGTPFGIQS
jgi:hypothetical protein